MAKIGELDDFSREFTEAEIAHYLVERGDAKGFIFDVLTKCYKDNFTIQMVAYKHIGILLDRVRNSIDKSKEL
ncbi:hypothetical protein [Piscirickettsia litoralis]|uniref:Uncharacterized protein n=1 Tax=Piscirickettsia litoralis TaxID=1891921 RepID=A0ABX2ZXB1_9GAMM|nr:hypothetical protein [Piscirickettsia litoralis]ODN41019.1 hypothetical protein BGC07_18480 [Piscirickettsia litoralis]